jgi:glucosyl-3-phosphoglycerate phosphatase
VVDQQAVAGAHRFSDPAQARVADAMAAEVVDRAAALQIQKMEPAIVLSSESARARQTAEAVASTTGMRILCDPRLREADIGEWEGLTRAEVQERYPREYRAWREGLDVRRGGGETYVEVADRAQAAVDEALRQLPADEALVVVTHGGTAKATIGRLLGLGSNSWHRLSSLGHGRWSALEEAAFGWRLDEHNVRPKRRPPPGG